MNPLEKMRPIKCRRLAVSIGLMLALCSADIVNAQSERMCDTPEGKQFDFWLGEWELTWPGGQAGTPEGEIGQGTNVVTRTLEDCIILENFRTDGFSGVSVSAYKRQTGRWHQTWVDSQGGYLSFTGEFRDGTMELRTEPFKNPDGEEQINRMIWTKIEENALDWYWQRSLDGGDTWEDLWTISYVRQQPASSP